MSRRRPRLNEPAEPLVAGQPIPTMDAPQTADVTAAGSSISQPSTSRPQARQLLAARAWRRWTLASFLARMPISMGLLGIILAGEAATGSLATGAHLAGTMTFTAGLLGPWRGARMDRREMRRSLQGSSLLLATAFAGLALAVVVEAPTAVLFAPAVLAGVGLAGMWGGFRALLLVVVTPDHLRQAHFVESLMVEVTYLLGPLVAGVVVGLVNAVAALLVMSAFALSATVALRYVTRLEPRAIQRSGAPWRKNPAIAVIYSFALLLGFGFASVESHIAARMEPYGLHSDRAGGFLVLLGLGSVVGGITVSIRPLVSKDPARLAAMLFFAFAVLLLPSALAGNVGIFACTLLFASVTLVPLNGLAAAELEHRIGDGHRGEAFGWLIAATMMGGGVGSALSGTLASAFHPRIVPLVSAATFGFCGLALLVARAIARRRTAAADTAVAMSSDHEHADLMVEEPA